MIFLSSLIAGDIVVANKKAPSCVTAGRVGAIYESPGGKFIWCRDQIHLFGKDADRIEWLDRFDCVRMDTNWTISQTKDGLNIIDIGSLGEFDQPGEFENLDYNKIANCPLVAKVLDPQCAAALACGNDALIILAALSDIVGSQDSSSMPPAATRTVIALLEKTQSLLNKAIALHNF